jgi:hypothetical protein
MLFFKNYYPALLLWVPFVYSGMDFIILILLLLLSYTDPPSIAGTVVYSGMHFILIIIIIIYIFFYSSALTSVPLSILQIAVTDFRQQGATQEEQESQAVGMRQVRISICVCVTCLG